MTKQVNVKDVKDKIAKAYSKSIFWKTGYLLNNYCLLAFNILFLFSNSDLFKRTSEVSD